SKPPKRNFPGLKSRLKQAGFDGAFVEKVLVPSWWDAQCKKEMLGDFEFEVARFLNVSIQNVRDPAFELPRPATSAKLRAPKGVDTCAMSAAIFAAERIAEAVVRNLAPSVPAFDQA